ncbi:MAG: type II toxin-antitoxin system HipA family toxin [Halomonas sp.]|nr:type II toxin-antitoxin system HipA family toxin [Halomonas sp.]TVP52985.1 MAG: type II toxin-antitoxin system HipA family toxin [Halomonas sp.]
MAYKPTQRLNVTRTLSTGEQVAAGVLAQNRQGVFFQYAEGYVEQYGNLSPFTLQQSLALQPAPKTPHQGLHGVFGDCLPDGWGLLLQDRVFRQHGIAPTQLTAMDRLAFVGQRGMGALAFEPASEAAPTQSDDEDLATLGLQAQAVFEGQTEDILSALVAAGSSGGARPKAQLFMPSGQFSECRTYAQPEDDAWLVKFTSQHLPLGHEEGLCEAAYLDLAKKAGLEPPEWQLLRIPTPQGERAWLAIKRFDWVQHTYPAGRLHMHSACGLLDADFRTPSLDYADLIKASRQLCKSPAVGQLQFKRALFNLFACNQDDHSKNWAFLQDDRGQWQPAPFYDVTFSPHPFSEHATAYMGFGKQPSLKAIQQLATHAGFANWQQAQPYIQEIVEVVSTFPSVAKDLGVKASTIELITQRLSQAWQENKGLLAS